WTLCNKIVGTPNEFTQITEGTHFKPEQFFGADYNHENIEYNKSLNLGANFFDGDFIASYFKNTSPSDKCVINLDTVWTPDNVSKYVDRFLNMIDNKSYHPPILFVNTVLKYRGKVAAERKFVDTFNSSGWT